MNLFLVEEVYLNMKFSNDSKIFMNLLKDNYEDFVNLNHPLNDLTIIKSCNS